MKNLLPVLEKPGSEVSHFIPEPRNFIDLTILPADNKKVWLKATFKEIKNLTNDHTSLMEEPEKGYPVTLQIDFYKANI